MAGEGGSAHRANLSLHLVRLMDFLQRGKGPAQTYTVGAAPAVAAFELSRHPPRERALRSLRHPLGPGSPPQGSAGLRRSGRALEPPGRVPPVPPGAGAGRRPPRDPHRPAATGAREAAGGASALMVAVYFEGTPPRVREVMEATNAELGDGGEVWSWTRNWRATGLKRKFLHR